MKLIEISAESVLPFVSFEKKAIWDYRQKICPSFRNRIRQNCMLSSTLHQIFCLAETQSQNYFQQIYQIQDPPNISDLGS